MGLRLHYSDAPSAILPQLLDLWVQRHFNFNLHDNFRIITPDSISALDLENALLDFPALEGVLIGKSIVSLQQFYQEMFFDYPQPRALASSFTEKKALQLAYKTLHPRESLDFKSQSIYLDRLKRWHNLKNYGSPVPALSKELKELLRRTENILFTDWKLWNEGACQNTIHAWIRQGQARPLKKVYFFYFVGFGVPPPALPALLSALLEGHPQGTYEMFLLPPEVLCDAQGFLSPLLESWEESAESSEHHRIKRDLEIHGVKFSTPLHEAQWLKTQLNTDNSSQGVFFPTTSWTQEILKKLLETIPDSYSGNSTLLPFQWLEELSLESSQTLSLAEVWQLLLPKFQETRQTMAHNQANRALFSLQNFYRLVMERLNSELFYEEKKSLEEWKEDLNDLWFSNLSPEGDQDGFNTQLRTIRRPGLKQYKQIYLANFNEDLIYQAKNTSPSFLFHEDPLESHEQKIHLRQTLSLAEQRVIFSFVKYPFTGRISGPSPLIMDFLSNSSWESPVVPLLQNRPQRHPFFEENVLRERNRKIQKIKSMDSGNLEIDSLGPLLLQSLVERPVSVTALEDYALCPWRFFARNRLKLTEPEQDFLGIEAKHLGSLKHAFLQKLYEEWIEKYFSQGKLPEESEIERSLEKVSEEIKILARSLPKTARLIEALFQDEMRRIRNNIEILVREEFSQWMKAKKKFLPYKLEWAFGNKDIPPLSWKISEKLSLSLRGIVDRIDFCHESGEFLLYDYKSSGSSELAKRVRAKRSFQLFLYLRAVQEHLFPHEEAAGALYWDLKKKENNQGFTNKNSLKESRKNTKGSSFMDTDQFLSLQTELTEALDQVLLGILKGSYQLQPEECQKKQCSFYQICRYEYSSES